jgi:outer membrane protein
MKKYLLLFAILFATLGANAQTKFGYLSYNEVYQLMPEYAAANQSMAALKEKYDAETQRADDEFNKKFGEFLQGQKDFPLNILQKRQKELQDLMEKSLAFKEEAKKQLTQAEKELQKPILEKLNAIIGQVGKERGYAFIINTDGNTCPFINPFMGEDVTQVVKDRIAQKQ